MLCTRHTRCSENVDENGSGQKRLSRECKFMLTQKQQNTKYKQKEEEEVKEDEEEKKRRRKRKKEEEA